MQRLHVLAAALALAAIAHAAPDEESEEPGVAAPELTAESFPSFLDAIRPTAAESEWRAVGWRTTLWSGIVDGHELKRPVLLWAMNGHPLGQT